MNTLRDLNENFVAVRNDRERLLLHIRIEIVNAGAAIELPAVPWADELSAAQISLTKRSTGMWTSAIDAE
jgi:hypothetical protein